MAAAMGVPFLGRIPLDPAVGADCDTGHPFIHHHATTPAAQAFARLAAPILALDPTTATATIPANTNPNARDNHTMKIAIPTAAGKLCPHFGHCEQFTLLEMDEQAKRITGQQLLTPPPHEPGALPRWLHQQGATVIIAGGMGARAQGLFAEKGIAVVVGAPADTPENLAAAYLAGILVSGNNLCDH